MEIVIRALVIYAFLWLVTRAVGRSTLGELSTFELVLYVTMGDLIQQAVTQQDYSMTGGMLAVGTFALATVAISALGWRFPRVRPLTMGKAVMLWNADGPIDSAMEEQRVSIADLLVEAREQGVLSTSQIEYVVLETDGKFVFFTKEQAGVAGGAPEKPAASE